MSLDPTFQVTPKSPIYNQGSGNYAYLYGYGVDFEIAPFDFQTQCTGDQWFFNANFATDPALDYSNWANIRTARFIQLSCDLSSFGPNKELALVFGFDAPIAGSDARLLIYSGSGQLADVTLIHGDNQFLMEVESLSQSFALSFVHVWLPNSPLGGYWLFKGISGYVI